jgi:hypothetical protein
MVTFFKVNPIKMSNINKTLESIIVPGYIEDAIIA